MTAFPAFGAWVNVGNFPPLAGDADDTARVQRAINAAPGATRP